MHTWHVTHSAASDTGLVRRHNEDRFHADPATGLFLVCDGMGDTEREKSPAAAPWR